MSSGFWHCVDLLVVASVSEKHTVSIFRAKVSILGSGGIGLEEGKTEGVGQSGMRNDRQMVPDLQPSLPSTLHKSLHFLALPLHF
jgi:hypothetical protein